MLSVNDSVEGKRIIAAVSKYISQKTNSDLKVRFKWTVLLADNDGNIGVVDMDPFNSIGEDNSICVPIKLIYINYNHYEPLYIKNDKENAFYQKAKDTKTFFFTNENKPDDSNFNKDNSFGFN